VSLFIQPDPTPRILHFPIVYPGFLNQLTDNKRIPALATGNLDLLPTIRWSVDKYDTLYLTTGGTSSRPIGKRCLGGSDVNRTGP